MMRNRVLQVCISIFLFCGSSCQRNSNDSVLIDVSVEVPPNKILTLSDQQLISLDWHSPNRAGARVKAKREIAGPGVEFDINFPSNSPANNSLNFVSSGEGGIGSLVGTDVRGYEVFALKFTLVSINEQTEGALKQKLVAGALIGPNATGQLHKYKPVILGLAASDNMAIAESLVQTDKIYQIGFHVHMFNPEDWSKSESNITLRVEPVENGGVVPD